MIKSIFQLAAALAGILLIPLLGYSQAPNLGASANFALFSTTGAVSNTGLSLLTGNVGSNNGPVTNFGNVDGVMHDADGATASAAADLTIAYNQLNAAIPTFFPSSLLGNGQVLNAGIYSVAGGATLSKTIMLFSLSKWKEQ
jgi:hypothetical protein